MSRGYLALVVIHTLAASLEGQQPLAERLAALPTGTVHLSFAARPGVCGDGLNHISTPQESAEWESDCENQPVRVALQLREHKVLAVRTYVGGHWRPGSSARDLGMVRPQDAASYLLQLASESRTLDGDPVLPATLADSVTIWPSLVRLARNPRLPEDRRRSAIFWLGQAAGAAATAALDSIASDGNGDRDVRKHAVFALSQRTIHDGIPALIRIARSNRDPELRRTALFWLGQSEDPRALDLFEEILR